MLSRKTGKVKFLFIALPLLLIIFLLTYFFIQWLFSDNVKLFFKKVVIPKKIIWSVDKIYSDTEKQKLSSFIQQSIDSGMFNFDTSIFYKELKKKHKVIKKVEWNFSNPDYAQLKVYGIDPKYLINNKFVLGNKKRLFQKDQFGEFEKEKFVELNIDNKFLGEKLDLNVYDFLNKTYKSDCWKKFRVAYLDKSRIEMLSNDSLQYLIKTDELNFDNNEKQNFVDLIYLDLMEEMLKNPKKYKNKVFVFDLRFRDKIFLRSLKRKSLRTKFGGGINYGK